MNWFIIINDTHCKKELEAFTHKHQESILEKREAGEVFDTFGEVLRQIKSASNLPRRITINSANTINILEIKDIVHCESHRNYTRLHLNNGTTHIVSKTLKQFETELKDSGFIRIHQSHLVNSNYISRYVKNGSGSLILTNGTKLTVATRKKEQFLKELNAK